MVWRNTVGEWDCKVWKEGNVVRWGIWYRGEWVRGGKCQDLLEGMEKASYGRLEEARRRRVAPGAGRWWAE